MIPKQMLMGMDSQSCSYCSCSYIQMIASLLEFNRGMQKSEVRDRGEGRRDASIDFRLKIEDKV